MTNKKPRNHTYNIADSVTVDEDTAEFLQEAEDWAEEASAKQEEIRFAKLNQALFKQGVMDLLCQNTNKDLMSYSDVYFQGYEYGHRVIKEIRNVAIKRFPAPTDDSKVKKFGEALLKKQVEIAEF